ncbi:MAG: hypothetical protein IPI18_05675 [Saprospiraceae bacterium]|nr:hypothetical protein [Saprospiraceae bacterium]
MKKINSIKILPVESYESLEEFEKIYKHFFNPLVNFINGYLSNKENSEEVVQNVFLRFWENKNQLNITGPVKSYLFQSAKNAMIDFTRRNKKYDHNESLVTGDHKKLFGFRRELVGSIYFQAICGKSFKKIQTYHS